MQGTSIRSHGEGDQGLFMPEADLPAGRRDTASSSIQVESKLEGLGNEGQSGSKWFNQVLEGGHGCVEASYQVSDWGTWI